MAIDFNTLFQTLNAANQGIAQEDPYAPISSFADNFGSTIVKNAPSLGTKDSLIAGLITGLTGGIFSGLGDDWQAEKSKLASDTLLKDLSGQDTTNNGLPPSVFSGIRNAGGLFRLQEKAAQQEELQQSAQRLIFSDPQKAQMLARSGIDPYALAGIERSQPSGTFGNEQGSPLGMRSESQDLFPDMPGAESLKSEYTQAVNDAINRGATYASARQEAKDLTEAKRKALTGSVDKAAEARKYADELQAMADTAITGIAGAGATGGLFSGLRNTASWVASSFNDDQANKQTATRLLDSIAPQIVKMNRSPGAVSDYETKLYLGAGPNRSELPQTNQLLADKIANVADLNRQYADFLDAYKAEKGTVFGADKLWQQYKQSYPTFTNNQDTGDIQINKDRPSWQDWLMQRRGAGSGSGTQNIPAGMKLQRNKVTGETRLVPQ